MRTDSVNYPKPKLDDLKPLPTRKDIDHYPVIVGHRGGAGLAPENTLAAFQNALELGIDGIEFDVQRTVDGEVIVFHDEVVDRLTGESGRVEHLTLEEIKRLDVGKGFDPKFTGERIPTLQETFEFLRGTHLTLHIEFKDAWLFEGIEQQVVDLIREFDYVDRAQVRAFYHPALHTVHQIDPEIAISELWYQHMPTEAETNFRTINAMADYYTVDVIAAIHARGQKATAWTVNDVDIAEGLIEMGIDGLTSDFPDRLMTLVRKISR